MMRRLFLSLFTLPAFFAHELTHCLVAAPWADRVAIAMDLQRGCPSAKIDWSSSDAPKAPAAIAPFVLGSALAVAGLLAWLMTGTPMPRGLGEVASTVVGLVWWLVFTVPSGDDLSYLSRSAPAPQPTDD